MFGAAISLHGPFQPGFVLIRGIMRATLYNYGRGQWVPIDDARPRSKWSAKRGVTPAAWAPYIDRVRHAATCPSEQHVLLCAFRRLTRAVGGGGARRRRRMRMHRERLFPKCDVFDRGRTCNRPLTVFPCGESSHHMSTTHKDKTHKPPLPGMPSATAAWVKSSTRFCLWRGPAVQSSALCEGCEWSGTPFDDAAPNQQPKTPKESSREMATKTKYKSIIM